MGIVNFKIQMTLYKAAALLKAVNNDLDQATQQLSTSAHLSKPYCWQIHPTTPEPHYSGTNMTHHLIALALLLSFVILCFRHGFSVFVNRIFS